MPKFVITWEQVARTDVGYLDVTWIEYGIVWRAAIRRHVTAARWIRVFVVISICTLILYHRSPIFKYSLWCIQETSF